MKTNIIGLIQQKKIEDAYQAAISMKASVNEILRGIKDANIDCFALDLDTDMILDVLKEYSSTAQGKKQQENDAIDAAQKQMEGWDD